MSSRPSAPPVPEYDRYYYENYEGAPYGRNPEWIARMGAIADHIVATLRPETALDAGCAMGILVEALRHRGVDAYGVDISEYAIEQIPEPTSDYCTQASLADPIERRFDLIISIEVLEHIDEPNLQRSLDNLCGATDRILFSSTPDHFEDPTHINIKQPEQWSIEFAARGFFRDLNYDASFIEPWSALYVRRELDLSTAIAEYDRHYWYMLRENHRARRGLIDLQHSLARIEQSLPAGTGDADAEQRVAAALEAAQRAIADAEAAAADADEARAEAVEARLAAQDELVGARREIGEARGRTAELEAELNAALQIRDAYDAMLRSTSWRVSQKLLTPYRRLRGLPD